MNNEIIIQRLHTVAVMLREIKQQLPDESEIGCYFRYWQNIDGKEKGEYISMGVKTLYVMDRMKEKTEAAPDFDTLPDEG